jgi:hypothetical protein
VTIKWRIGRGATLLTLIMSLLVSTSCGDVSRTGRAPAFLVIDFMKAASGAQAGQFGDALQSDVVTVASGTSTVFEDLGQVQVRVLLKDQGNPGATAGPSNLNWLKITRYRVVYRRADGRNMPGVDVPYPFDGAVTMTVTNQPQSLSFTLVRIQAKREAPLMALGTGGAIAISTITEVTFYGEDLAGNEFQSTGSISINFANWPDPQ